MKTLMGAALACALVASSLVPAAADDDDADELLARLAERYARYRASEDGQDAWAARHSGYRDYDADELPYGSSSWWQQMDREQRGGRSLR
jgi:hypothetical protein